METYTWRVGLFQLQMRISFPFLRARDLRTYYWSWELVFFHSPVRRGYIRKVSVNLVQKYFLHDCSTDSISCSERVKKESDKKYQNDATTRQTQYSVTVSDEIARKINTTLSLPIHRARSWAAAVSDVLSDPLDTSYILCRRIRCRCCSLCVHLPPPTPPLPS